MRVTSELFVSAFVRRVFADGGYAAILRRGNAEAGAIFIAIMARDGSRTLYGPAPQSLVPADSARAFAARKSAENIDATLASEVRFDPDLWIIEAEGFAKPLDDYLEIVSG
jgi:hypothetical protein